MKKFFSYIVPTVSIIAGVITVIGFIFQIESDKPKLEILEITSDNLTNLPKVKNLTSRFYYKDSLISNLWKLNIQVKNIGQTTLIAEGNKKNIIGKSLSFLVKDGFKLIDFDISDSDFPIKIEKKEDGIGISFSQWRVNETIKATIYAEEVDNTNDDLEVFINEREIIDGTVEYRKINQSQEEDKQLADYLPITLREILYWLGIVIYGLLLIIMPIGIIVSINTHLAYYKWKKEWMNSFKKEMRELKLAGKIEARLKPDQVSEEVWKQMKTPEPTGIPDTSFVILLLSVLITSVIVLIPILWMIKI